MNLADVFSVFRGTAPSGDSSQPSQQTQQPATGKLPDGTTSALEGQRADPSQPAPGAGEDSTQQQSGQQPQKDSSPLDDFSKIWDTSNQGSNQPPSLNADPVKIGEAAKKINFAKAADPALVQKALSGDNEAFMQVLNQVAQQTFAVATQASTHLVDRHTAANREYLTAELPAHLRKFQANDSLITENPKLAHPAVQPLLTVIQQQLAAQFPQATASDLKAHSLKYLQGVMQAMGVESTTDGSGSQAGPGRGGRQQELQARNAFDWDSWAVAQGQDR